MSCTCAYCKGVSAALRHEIHKQEKRTRAGQAVDLTLIEKYREELRVAHTELGSSSGGTHGEAERIRS